MILIFDIIRLMLPRRCFGEHGSLFRTGLYQRMRDISARVSDATSRLSYSRALTRSLTFAILLTSLIALRWLFPLVAID